MWHPAELAAIPGPQRMQLAALARNSVFSAGAMGSAFQSWKEVARPLVSIGFNDSTAAGHAGPGGAGIAVGASTTFPQSSLPVGTDLKSITCTVIDIDTGWMATSFKIGTLELFPQGLDNLTIFDPRLEHVDRIAPWIMSELIVDLTLNAVLFNGGPTVVAASTQVFHGFSFNVFAATSVCQIQNRLKQTERAMGNLDAMDHLRGMYSVGLGLPFHTTMMQPSAAIGARAAMYPTNNPYSGQALQAPPTFALQGRIPMFAPPPQG